MACLAWGAWRHTWRLVCVGVWVGVLLCVASFVAPPACYARCALSAKSSLLREEHARLGLHWPPTHPQIEAMELREYGLCKSIAVPSLFVERSFHKRGINAKAMNRNALGVSLKEFKPSTEAPLPPSQCGLKVIYAGSLSVRKGIPDLLSGFKRANLPESSLILLGGDTPELKEMLNQQPSCVLRLGHRPQAELVQHYQQSHCFVMASIEDGFGMVLAQALACGVPIISTTNTGGEDLLRMQGSKSEGDQLDIQQFPAGFVVPIHRPDALARCMQRLQNEPLLWERMREAALELASSELSWSAYGDRAISHYKKLLAQQ